MEKTIRMKSPRKSTAAVPICSIREKMQRDLSLFISTKMDQEIVEGRILEEGEGYKKKFVSILPYLPIL